MIKRILFDLDNTLIPFLPEWDKEIENTFKDLGLPYEDEYFDIIHKALHEYESTHLRFDKVGMSKYFNTKFDFEIPDTFVDVWVSRLKVLVPEDNTKVVELIKYLSSKYSLCVVTNWFYDQQVNKLKIIGILDYFDEIYTSDKYNRKPNSEMLEKACEDFKIDEVVMVGDTYNIDTKFAMNYGVYSYLLNSKWKIKSKKYKVIKELNELRRYL